MRQKYKTNHRKKLSVWLSAAVMLLCVLGLAACGAPAEKAHKVTPEEMDFFKAQIQRNVSSLSDAELEAAARDYITEVNATYWLGHELELCEPFDFDSLQQAWKDENAEREAKRETGQVYYGPDVLTLDVYFPYQYSALQSDIVRVILDNRDEALVADARTFYEDHPEIFTKLLSIQYETNYEGEITQHTIEEQEFRFYGQSDPQLMDFLAMAQDGQSTTLTAGSHTYTVTRLGVTTEILDFEDNERIIVEMFLSYERMGQWLDQLAQAHPVLF